MATAGRPCRRAAASHGRRSADLTLVASTTVRRRCARRRSSWRSMARKAAPVARWSAAFPLIAARSASDDRTSSGWKQPIREGRLAGTGRADEHDDRWVRDRDALHRPMMHVRIDGPCVRPTWDPTRLRGPPSCGSAATFGCMTTRLCLRPASGTGRSSRSSCSTRSCSTVGPRRRIGRGSSSRPCGPCVMICATLGSDLVVRTGDPRLTLPTLAHEIGATDVYASRDHAPYGRARDRDRGRSPRRHPASPGTRRPGCSSTSRKSCGPPKVARSVSTPRSVGRGRASSHGRCARVRATCHRCRRASRPATCRAPPRPPTADPTLMPSPGEAAARQRLQRWLEHGLETYDRTRDRLALSDGTSRLSQDLHLGLLSPTEVAASADRPGEGPRTFRSELIWREFYAHVLFHWPAARSEAMQPAFRDLPWSDDDDAFEAWTAGRTGYPVVDAAMRQLAATGWMHNRARMLDRLVPDQGPAHRLAARRGALHAPPRRRRRGREQRWLAVGGVDGHATRSRTSGSSTRSCRAAGSIPMVRTSDAGSRSWRTSRRRAIHPEMP